MAPIENCLPNRGLGAIATELHLQEQRRLGILLLEPRGPSSNRSTFLRFLIGRPLRFERHGEYGEMHTHGIRSADRWIAGHEYAL